jgi:hypothetical protein
MAKITTSAKGSKVDFDLLQIKQEMANIPTSINVTTRQKFVDEKSSKAKPKAGEVPEAIKNADWNVVNDDVETVVGDIQFSVTKKDTKNVK